MAVWVVKGVLRVAQYVAPGRQRATTGDREAKGRVGLKGARSYYERPEGSGGSYRPESLRAASYWRISALRQKIAGPVIPSV